MVVNKTGRLFQCAEHISAEVSAKAGATGGMRKVYRGASATTCDDTFFYITIFVTVPSQVRGGKVMHEVNFCDGWCSNGSM